jgi:hypothetical protein
MILRVINECDFAVLDYSSIEIIPHLPWLPTATRTAAIAERYKQKYKLRVS